MRFNLFKDGEYVNDIICDEDFVKFYSEQNGYTYEESAEPTPEELIQQETRRAAEQEIQELKDNLSSTDYEAIKYAEGWMTDKEYAPIKKKRQEWREKINELEANTHA